MKCQLDQSDRKIIHISGKDILKKKRKKRTPRVIKVETTKDKECKILMSVAKIPSVAQVTESLEKIC